MQQIVNIIFLTRFCFVEIQQFQTPHSVLIAQKESIFVYIIDTHFSIYYNVYIW